MQEHNIYDLVFYFIIVYSYNTLLTLTSSARWVTLLAACRSPYPVLPGRPIPPLTRVAELFLTIPQRLWWARRLGSMWGSFGFKSWRSARSDLERSVGTRSGPCHGARNVTTSAEKTSNENSSDTYHYDIIHVRGIMYYINVLTMYKVTYYCLR